jgi:hypothetical protein
MGNKLVVLLAIALVALLTGGTAWADSVPINNPSFETSYPLDTSCGYFNCAYTYGIPDWTVSNGGTWRPGPVVFPSMPDGTLAAFTNRGSIWQTLSSTVLPDTTYTLNVFVGNRADGVNGPYTLSLDTILNGVLTTLCSTPVLDANNIAAHTFQSEGCSYTSNSTVPGGNLFLIFTAVGGQLDVDDVSLTDQPMTTVPEPGSALLLVAGLALAIGFGLWSKQRTTAVNA